MSTETKLGYYLKVSKIHKLPVSNYVYVQRVTQFLLPKKKKAQQCSHNQWVVKAGKF
jgi:hypothetical protein